MRYFVPHFIVLAFVNQLNGTPHQDFECDSSLCICPDNSNCLMECTNNKPCIDLTFNCTSLSSSCTIQCIDDNSCSNSVFNMMTSISTVQCFGSGCAKTIIQCGDNKLSNNTIHSCSLLVNSDKSLSTQFYCYGGNTNCQYQIMDPDESITASLICNLNDNNLNGIACTVRDNKLECYNEINSHNLSCLCIGNNCGDIHPYSLSTINPITPTETETETSMIAHNSSDLYSNSDLIIWIIMIVVLVVSFLSCILYNYFLNYFLLLFNLYNYSVSFPSKYHHQKSIINRLHNHKKHRDRNNNNKQLIISNINSKKHKSRDTSSHTHTHTQTHSVTVSKSSTNNDVQTQKYFSESYWLTIISLLFNDMDKSFGIDCGIIVSVDPDNINDIFLDCIQCKCPVTEMFLKYFALTLCSSGTYIIIYNGFIYGYNYQLNGDIVRDKIVNNCIIIDSEKNQTRRSCRTYYRIYINRIRCRNSSEFVSILHNSYSISVSLTGGGDSTTTTYIISSSLELSSSFLNHHLLETQTAKILSTSLRYLQEMRHNKNNDNDNINSAVEHVGATIVLIPSYSSLSDFRIYLRQYVPVNILINESTLYCIFSHNSELHDGAIFIRNNRIIAVKSFFRLTGKIGQNGIKTSIGHGTRHASAQEFTKKSNKYKTICFVLSEEDGYIRTCINGELKKIDYTKIPLLIMQKIYYNKTEKKKIIKKNIELQPKTKTKTVITDDNTNNSTTPNEKSLIIIEEEEGDTTDT